jgi:amino acid adenylation domain-containing protein
MLLTRTDIKLNVIMVNGWMEQNEAFWVDQLTHFELVDVPYAQRTFRGDQTQSLWIKLPLAHNLVAQLTEQYPGWDLGDLWLAVFVIYLARIGATQKVGIGFSDHDLKSKILGHEAEWAGHLPLSIEVDTQRTLPEFLEVVQRQLDTVRQHLPCRRDLLTRDSALGATPFTIIVDQVESIQNYTPEDASLLALVIESNTAESYLFYQRNAFETAGIEALTAQFMTLLQAIVESGKGTDRAQFLVDLPLLTEAERHRILVEWNATAHEFPDHVCLHQLIEAQVERTPDATAVVFEGQRLTYRELNAQANQLAHYLQTLGVKPDTLVGICADRSLEMVVALLGILKAGGAYVPLDPGYPQERLAYMLEDAAVSVLLTQQRCLDRLPSQLAMSVVCLDTEGATLAQYSTQNPEPPIQPEHLAYVIYTSGSTGRPKGVMNSHAGVCNRLLWMQDYYQLTAADKVLQKTPFSFDVSVWEFFWPLLAGAQLVVAKPGGHKDTAYLVELITRHSITTMHFVPPMLQMFLADPAVERCHSLKRVICSGEALPVEVQNRFFERLNSDLNNLYGPTEAAIDVSYWQCRLDTALQTVPIGRPVANTQLYILDPHRNPVPVGVVGELYIGGIQVARGYLNRPDLTQERFISNPFGAGRLYKTGDLARYRHDGEIEYLGRIDHQVKVRGFRIELGEIEATLGEHPSVHQAVVVVHGDQSDDKRIVAYVVPKAQSSVDAHQLRGLLQTKLPEYMIPQAFVCLDALPLTLNGKIDRQALPAPEDIDQDITEVAAPRTPTEVALVRIWQQVLRQQPIGIDDNFWHRGGHSLLAMRVAALVEQELGQSLPIGKFFALQTIAEQADYLNQQLAQSAQPTLPPIQPAVRQPALPLSFPQRQLWFFDQLHPTEPVYNETMVFHIPEAIDPVVLEQALNQLLDRHEILRTTFTTQADQPVQVVHEPQPLPMRTLDLSDRPETERVAIAHELATAELKALFDLQQWPLWRVTLIKLDETDWRLYFSAHHIIMDGISMYNIFLPELEALYRSQLAGQPAALPAPPRQYADFAVWQNQVLTEAILSPQLNYWQQKLADLPTLQLPTDRPLTAKTSFRGARQCLSLSSELTEQLNYFSQQAGVTLFVTLATALNILLYRYTGQDDLVIGTIHGGRNRLEAQNIMGNFLNNLVLRTDISGQPTVRELLARVNTVVTEAYQAVDIPFEQLVNTLQPERTVWQTPFFQVALVIEPPLPTEQITWGLSQLDIHAETAKFDITFELDERPEGIIGRVEYSTDLFDAATITRMIGHFQVLLESIVQNPHQAIADLPLLTAAEWQALTFKDNVTLFPQGTCLHQRFEAQVEQNRDAIAVIFEDQHLTYGELNRKANQLAHYLQHLGVKPDFLVGLCVERSLEMVIGILGILKAGGAYVPIDPNYPQERQQFILADANISILVTQQSLSESLSHPLVQVVYLDRDWHNISTASPSNPISRVTPENLAYIIYTSGSTGKPKGVLITHQNVIRLFCSTQIHYAFNNQDCWTLFHSFAFDFSVWELWGALLYGGRLVVVPYWVSRSPEAFYQLLVQQRVTVLNQTPSAFLQLIQVDPSYPVAALNLRYIIFGGEALQVQSLRPWFERHGDACPQLVNMYGITETTVHVTYQPLTQADLDQPKMPIGQALADLQLYVLGPNLQPVPLGVPGELHVGGAGLARGYLNRPELTAERFIENPFGEGRLYKTGDLVRWLANGTLEYLGRIDHQVKVRGFRIELGEIEATLNQHPTVQQSLVLVRQDEPGDQRLVAYMIPANPENFSLAEVRQWLDRQLPDYMVPSGFVPLDQFPLTPNGKVDRQALPAPDRRANQEDTVIVPSRTPTEQIIVELWQDILKLDQVSIHDNFFALGGHSLLAVQLMTKLKPALAVKLSLQTLLEAPTPAELADYIDTILWSRSRQGNGDALPIAVNSGSLDPDELDSDALEEIEL